MLLLVEAQVEVAHQVVVGRSSMVAYSTKNQSPLMMWAMWPMHYYLNFYYYQHLEVEEGDLLMIRSN